MQVSHGVEAHDGGQASRLRPESINRRGGCGCHMSRIQGSGPPAPAGERVQVPRGGDSPSASPSTAALSPSLGASAGREGRASGSSAVVVGGVVEGPSTGAVAIAAGRPSARRVTAQSVAVVISSQRCRTETRTKDSASPQAREFASPQTQACPGNSSHTRKWPSAVRRMSMICANSPAWSVHGARCNTGKGEAPGMASAARGTVRLRARRRGWV